MNSPTLILPTALGGSELVPSEVGQSITSIMKSSFLEVVEIRVLGSDALSLAIEHLPAIRHVMPVNVRRDVVLPIREDHWPCELNPGPIPYGSRVQLSVLLTPCSHRVRMVRITLERRGEVYPSGRSQLLL